MNTYHPQSGAVTSASCETARALPEYGAIQTRILRENLALIEQQKGMRMPRYRRGKAGHIRAS